MCCCFYDADVRCVLIFSHKLISAAISDHFIAIRSNIKDYIIDETVVR